MVEPVGSLPPPAKAGQSLVVAGSVIIAIGALYVGAGIFVPLVLAVLLTFALAPMVRVLRRLHLPHIAAVLLSVAGAALLIGLIAFLIVTQLARLAGDIPQYQQIVGDKVRMLQQTFAGGEFFDRIATGIQEFGSSQTSLEEATQGQQPVPVTIRNPPQSPLDFVGGFLGSLLGPLATAAIVTVFVVFLLLEREDFRDRFLKLVSRGDLRTSTQVMNEAGKRVSRYLLVQFAVNSCYGIVFGVGLYFIGIPNPVLWGLFAGLFRYIPFVGTLIAATIPFALAFAVDPGWGMLIASVALFVVLELTVTNAIEPRLYGSSTGLSALAVIVAAMFWATLWGPIGLILATPLTVCLVVLGRYVPQLQFLEILLGSEPVLVREEQLYQRLLAGNIEEAVDVAENYLAENSAPAFYDDVAIPALRLAEADRGANLTDLASRRQVVDGMAAIVREVEHLAQENTDGDDSEARPILPPIKVLCIGGRSELDGAAADMLAQVLARRGVTVSALPPLAVRQEGIGQMDLDGVDVICLAYLGANPRTYVRFVARRVKRRTPDVRVVACLFNPDEATDAEALRIELEADAVVFTVAGAEAQIRAIQQAHAPRALVPEPGEDRAGLVHRLRRATARGQDLDDFVTGVAAAFKVQIAMVLVPEDRDTSAAPANGEAAAPPAATADSLGAQVMAAGEILVAEEVSTDAALAENAYLLENGIRFFAGAPLRSPSGLVVGALSIFDHEPRPFAQADRQLLQDKADALMARIAGDAGETALA